MKIDLDKVLNLKGSKSAVEPKIGEFTFSSFGMIGTDLLIEGDDEDKDKKA